MTSETIEGVAGAAEGGPIGEARGCGFGDARVIEAQPSHELQQRLLRQRGKLSQGTAALRACQQLAVGGVQVEAIHVDSSEPFSFVTMQDGSYAVDLPEGSYRLLLGMQRPFGSDPITFVRGAPPSHALPRVVFDSVGR